MKFFVFIMSILMLCLTCVYKNYDLRIKEPPESKRIVKNTKMYFRYTKEGLDALLQNTNKDKIIQIDTVIGVDTAYYIEIKK